MQQDEFVMHIIPRCRDTHEDRDTSGVRFSGARSKEAKAFPGRLQPQSYLFGVHP